MQNFIFAPYYTEKTVEVEGKNVEENISPEESFR